jgi:hypothetical protein
VLNRLGDLSVKPLARSGDRRERKYCVLDDACQALMKTAMRRLQLTARAYHRVLKFSRTIADLTGSRAINPGAFSGGTAVQAQTGFDVIQCIVCRKGSDYEPVITCPRSVWPLSASLQPPPLCSGGSASLQG